MKKMLPYGYHSLDDQDIDSEINALKRHAITQGELSEIFGQKLADYSGAKFGVSVCNGTAALHIAAAAIDIGPGSEVITTPMTFCATANAALYLGAEVKFVDIEKNTLNIDPALIEEKISDKTKAVIPVDFRGHPAQLSEIKQIGDKYHLKIIEDASHSIGSRYKINNEFFSCGNGKYADLITFSFHPVKHITTGEGGAILTDNENLFTRINTLRKHGIDRREDMFNEEERKGSWIYDMERLGFNYRMTEFQAALGLNQLKKIEQFKKRRREIVNYYNDKLIICDDLILPYEDEDVDSNFHLYVLQIKENKRFDRYDFFYYLRNMKISPMVHYIPVHLLSYYKSKYGYKRGDFPVAEQYYDRAISIPLYPSMNDSEVEYVVDTISRFINK